MRLLLFLLGVASIAHSTHSAGSQGEIFSSRKLAQLTDLPHYSNGASESTDNREEVTESTHLPYSAIGPVVSAASGNSLIGCTGSLIDYDVVLTAAHCLYGSDGAPVQSSKFAPGYSSNQDPAAPAGFANMIDFRVPQEYQSCGEGYTECHRSFDYGIIKLDVAFEMRMDIAFDNDNAGDETINTAGYPGDRDDCFGIDNEGGSQCVLFHASCADGYIDQGVAHVDSDCYSEQGQSGSPMWNYFPESQTRQIRGVLAASIVGSSSASFTLITENVFNEINEIINAWKN